MVNIHSDRDNPGSRTYISQGRHTTVIDGLFDDAPKAVHTTTYATTYTYGS